MWAGSVRRARPRGLAVALVGLVAGAAVLLGATSAQAHNVLRGTDPADGSTVTVAPAQITLTFDEPGLALGTEVEVRSPDGSLVSDGDPVLVDATVTQKLAGELPAGDYSVAWRVTSADGHPITGELTFTTTESTTIGDVAAPSASPTPEGETTSGGTTSGGTTSDNTTSDNTTSGDEGGSGSAPVIVAVVVAALVLAWLLWRRRRPRDVPGDE